MGTARDIDLRTQAMKLEALLVTLIRNDSDLLEILLIQPDSVREQKGHTESCIQSRSVLHRAISRSQGARPPTPAFNPPPTDYFRSASCLQPHVNAPRTRLRPACIQSSIRRETELKFQQSAVVMMHSNKMQQYPSHEEAP